jgi:hypothetical protein
MRRVRSQTEKRRLMCADSGAEVNCVESREFLDAARGIRNFNPPESKPDILLHTTTGENMDIIAKGDVNKHIKSAYVCPDSASLLSLQRMRKKGYWTLSPPTNVSPNDAVIIMDSTGKVCMVGDDEWMIDIDHPWEDTINYTMDLPDLRELLREINKEKRS